MKNFVRVALPLLLLLTIISCGDDGDNDNIEQVSKNGRRRCHTSTSGEDWKEFVDNVKNLDFLEFSSHRCWESSQFFKLLNCDRKGIFYICDGTSYSKHLGGKTCTSGPLHEALLISLVTPRPTNFEAEFCEGKMVRAKIAVAGKGKETDQYHFDFERPASHNPVFKKVWKDTDRRYHITVRQ